MNYYIMRYAPIPRFLFFNNAFFGNAVYFLIDKLVIKCIMFCTTFIIIVMTNLTYLQI